MYYFNCEHCGKEIVVKYKSKIRRFCSNSCASRHKYNHSVEDVIYIEKKCSNCGSVISMRANDHRLKRGQVFFFCNHKCESEYRMSIKPPKNNICPICKNTFIKHHCTQKTCSRYCQYKLSALTNYNRHFNTNFSYDEYVKIKEKEKEYKELKKISPPKRVGRDKEYMREYMSTIEYKKRRKKREIERIRNNPIYKMSIAIRKSICNYAKRFGKVKQKKHTEDILKCDFQTFKTHMERLFTPDMCWDNYGIKWHIDHVIPISLAKTLDEFYLLNNFTNLQPLLASDNIIKRDKILPNITNVIMENCKGYEHKCIDLCEYARRKNL